MATVNRRSNFAFFINGVYESVLKDIISAQKNEPGRIFYLQPYKGSLMREFRKKPPTVETPIRFFASVTDRLNEVSYQADLVGWENKLDLFEESFRERKNFINEQIRNFQPNEQFLYRNVGKTLCANLLSIKNLKKIERPFPVSNLIKRSDGQPLKKRSRAGGWSYVQISDFVQDSEIIPKKQFDDEYDNRLIESNRLNPEARRNRLENASEFPEQRRILSIGFVRNTDVVAEVMYRAKGICELCKQPAPFLKASDGSPYLEVHHWKPLAEGGKDNLKNAAALCPNCHKQAHFGQNKEFIKTKRKLLTSGDLLKKSF